MIKSSNFELLVHLFLEKDPRSNDHDEKALKADKKKRLLSIKDWWMQDDKNLKALPLVGSMRFNGMA